MATRVYHLDGPSGSGKSTIGRELAGLGQAVIEADFAPGLAAWVELATGRRVLHQPPFSAEWLAAHDWRWNGQRLEELLAEIPGVAFVAGGASNQHEYAHLFTRVFVPLVDNATLRRRLQAREPERWLDDSPELDWMLEFNARAADHYAGRGCVLLDGTRPTAELVEQILALIAADGP